MHKLHQQKVLLEPKANYHLNLTFPYYMKASPGWPGSGSKP